LISRQLLVTRDAQIVASDFMSNIEQLPSIIDKIKYFKADVLVTDACEWMFDRSFNHALKKTGVKLFSLCVDQNPPNDVDMYFISHYFENPHNQEIHRLKADWGDELDGLIILSELSANWLGEAFNRGLTTDNRSLLDFVLGRNALTAGGAITVDHAFQGTWHTLYIAQVRNNEQRLLWISNAAIRPVMFPGLEAPSDWQHNLTIYWRNAGGLWRATTVGER
jgi:urea transport system substrate-binding protein